MVNHFCPINMILHCAIIQLVQVEKYSRAA